MNGAVEKLTVSRLARLGGVNLETVRYYERKGLLPQPPRTPSGYRVFPRDAVRQLRFIKRAQELGFSLKEIHDLLSLRMRPGISRADIRARADAKVADDAAHDSRGVSVHRRDDTSRTRTILDGRGG